MQLKRKWLRRGFLRQAGSAVRGLSFMDLEAPHDDVLTQKDQTNAAFLLHGYGLLRVCLWAALAALTALAGGPAARADTLANVRHVVILMQENRSFDHYFGTRQGVRGFNDPNLLLFQNGSSALFQPAGSATFALPFPVTNPCINDVDHSENGGLDAWNHGWWNQWVPVKGPEVMAYYSRTNLPFYHALADAYTLCDANFCSFTGPTFPNRLYLFSGMVDPAGTGGGPALDNNIPTNGYSWTTYPERLQAAGVDWKVYRPVGDWFGDALQWFTQYKKAARGNPLHDRGMATVTNVLTAFAADVTNGTLPQVSWIIPQDLSWSEHPPYSTERGEWFVRQIVAALAANPSVYDSTVFILTYDENGGFFDHVPPPVPPPGTTNEFVNGEPLGLGIRVPLFVVSPWSRGGRVCSQVFDHTSIIRFLETWTGVVEPNISDWRRQTCGDLTSALDFAHPDTSLPALPEVTFGNESVLAPSVPAVQILPVQDPGVLPACPLPYQPDASCTTDGNSNRVNLTMTNAGTAAVHFAVYPNRFRAAGPWQFDAPPGGCVTGSFLIPAGDNGQYDYTCYGPNGFQRRFAGNINADSQQIEITSSLNPADGSLTLGLLNSAAAPAAFTVADNLNPAEVQTYALPPAATTNCTFPVLTNDLGWYDVTVTAASDTNFVRHLAGHLETGAASFTQPPVIVGNPLMIPTTPPIITVITVATNPVPPGITSLNDMVNQTIAQNSLATSPTNSLVLTVAAYANQLALIYPAWASNYMLESAASLAPTTWSPLNAPLSLVSNCNVVILPATNRAGFFRLHQ